MIGCILIKERYRGDEFQRFSEKKKGKNREELIRIFQALQDHEKKRI